MRYVFNPFSSKLEPISDGVVSLNGITGAVTLAAGANIGLSALGNTITISASDNDSSYLTADGTTVGATSQAQTFTFGVKTGLIFPVSDSTTALQITKTDRLTSVLTVDTTNSRLGIGMTPNYALDVNGTINSNNMIQIASSNNNQCSFTYANNTSYLYPYQNYNRARGTLSSLVAVQAGDYIGSTNFYGYNGSIYAGVAGFAATVASVNGSNLVGNLGFAVGDGTSVGANYAVMNMSYNYANLFVPFLTIQNGQAGNNQQGIYLRGNISGGTLGQQYNFGSIYSYCSSTGYNNVRITIANPTGEGTFKDTLSVQNGMVGIRFASAPTALLQCDTYLDAWYADDGSKPTWLLSYNGTVGGQVCNMYMGTQYDMNIANPYAGVDYGGLHFLTGGLGNTYERITITKAGNVGIGTLPSGTSAPLSLLQVGVPPTANSIYDISTVTRILGTAQSTTDQVLMRLNRGESGGLFYPASVDFKIGAYNSGGAGTSYNPATRFTIALKNSSSYNEGADVNVMTLQNNGNVGIGLTNPSQLLTLKSTGSLAWDNGSGTADVGFSRTAAGTIALGNGTASDASGTLSLAKLKIVTGSNATIGTGTLVGGTKTISTTAVTASSLIFLTDTSGGVNFGALYVGTINAGVSFVVNSANALDTSSFNWLIIN